MQQKLYDAEVVRMKDMLGKQSGGSSIADLSNEELMELLG